MAGSGKTTLMQRLYSHLGQASSPCYVINLDPAVSQLPYEPHIDIRDTVRALRLLLVGINHDGQPQVNYKNVMKEYGLGPNGGILTSLNLFTTKFDQVPGCIEL